MACCEKLSSFTRCSRHGFLCAYSELDDGRDGVRVLQALLCLRRELFTYFTSTNFPSRFYALRSTNLGLSVFYANQLYFHLFGTFFSCCFTLLLFFILARRQRQGQVTSKKLAIRPFYRQLRVFHNSK